MALPERAHQAEPDYAKPHQAERSQPEELRLHRSATDIEQEFAKEISLERHRRDWLRHTTERRMHKRAVERRHKRGSMRFALLVLTLILTAAVVTVVMFRTLYLLLS
jgi:hypothetical protein